MTDFTNASTPPNNCRLVLVLTITGDKVRAWRSFTGQWFAVDPVRIIQAAGWRELEASDAPSKR